MNKIVVIGSLNLDIIQNISRLPLQGETLRVDSRGTNLGGKGANQAVAATRQNEIDEISKSLEELRVKTEKKARRAGKGFSIIN